MLKFWSVLPTRPRHHCLFSTSFRPDMHARDLAAFARTSSADEVKACTKRVKVLFDEAYRVITDLLMEDERPRAPPGSPDDPE